MPGPAQQIGEHRVVGQKILELVRVHRPDLVQSGLQPGNLGQCHRAVQPYDRIVVMRKQHIVVRQYFAPGSGLGEILPGVSRRADRRLQRPRTRRASGRRPIERCERDPGPSSGRIDRAVPQHRHFSWPGRSRHPGWARRSGRSRRAFLGLGERAVCIVFMLPLSARWLRGGSLEPSAPILAGPVPAMKAMFGAAFPAGRTIPVRAVDARPDDFSMYGVLFCASCGRVGETAPLAALRPSDVRGGPGSTTAADAVSQEISG